MLIYKGTHSSFLYAFDYQFSKEILAFCRELKDKYGNQNFNFRDKAWRFNLPQIAYDIKERFPQTIIHASMAEDLQRYELERQDKDMRVRKALDLREAADVNLMVPGLKGELYPYQKVGVAFFENNNGKAILADTMGAGKTVQSLAYILKSKRGKTLVICPASAKSVWKKEVKKWTPLTPMVIDSKSSLDPKSIAEHDIFIVNYDILAKHFEHLSAYRFDCVVMDEVHYIKNVKAKRTKLAMTLGRQSPSLLLLSGTPVLSRPVEIFNALNLMDPTEWPDWFSYVKKYCDAKPTAYGLDTRGASNVDELKERIAPYILRRTKDEILPELPDKRYIDVPVQLEKTWAGMYQKTQADFIKYLKDAFSGRLDATMAEIQAQKLVQLGKLRQIASQGKVYAARELIDGILDAGEKVIVFSVYNGPLMEMHSQYEDKSVLLVGSTKEADREAAVDRFQEDPDTRIFFGGLKSSGVALTLTAATNVIFLDYSWVPADHRQGEDRMHRPGQTADKVSIYQLYAEETVDDRIRELLERKGLLVGKLLGDSDDDVEKMSESLENAVLKSFYKAENVLLDK